MKYVLALSIMLGLAACQDEAVNAPAQHPQATTEAASTEAASTEAAPTEAAPTEAAPTEAAPVEAGVKEKIEATTGAVKEAVANAPSTASDMMNKEAAAQ